jgi:pimeloyl-ACP methyl ester carboxylesterase
VSGRLVSDAPLAHLRWGDSGPLVVLMHGVGGGREAWGDTASGTGAALAGAGFRALAIDFPGYGLSPAIDPYDLAGMASAVERLIRSQGEQSAILVGHSMGGMVAQELAATFADRVAALVLASTSPAFGKPGGDWQQAFLQSRFAPLDAGLGMAGLAAQLVPGMVAPGVPLERQAAAQALMAGVPEATYRLAVAALVAFDRRANLPFLRVPTLVITGEHDRTAAPEVARRMAERIEGSQLQIVPGAGHLLNIEQPEAFNSALLRFLKGALS